MGVPFGHYRTPAAVLQSLMRKWHKIVNVPCFSIQKYSILIIGNTVVWVAVS